jgi:hypothetical protein
MLFGVEPDCVGSGSGSGLGGVGDLDGDLDGGGGVRDRDFFRGFRGFPERMSAVSVLDTKLQMKVQVTGFLGFLGSILVGLRFIGVSVWRL